MSAPTMPDDRRAASTSGQSSASGDVGSLRPGSVQPRVELVDIHGEIEVRVSKSFQGVINVDIRDSVPDWAPFEAPKAPEGAPSVLYIVLDDVGFSVLSGYGGPVSTPNIDRIIAEGGRYTQMHTASVCAPTRSCRLTGRNRPRNEI